MQTEGMFWRNTVKPRVTGRWDRIETRTKDGFPDCIAVIGRRTSLVELKSKKTYESMLGCKLIQAHFLYQWCMDGGDAWLLAQCGSRILLVSGIAVWEGHQGKLSCLKDWENVARLSNDRSDFDWEYMCSVVAAGVRAGNL